MSEFVRKLRWLLGRRERDAELRQELEFHLSEEADERRERGARGEEARLAARRELGNFTRVQEETRAAWGWTLVEQLGQDVRYGIRALRKCPSFTTAAALTLALGIGANTAIFSLLDAVVLKSLPVRNPQELVFPAAAGSAGRSGTPPYPCLMRLRVLTQAFAGLSAYSSHDELRLEIDGTPEQASGYAASGNFFEVLGIRAAVGRLLQPEDEKMNPPAAVLSHRYWERRFGGRADAVGKTFVHGRRTYTIVGVTPPEFLGIEPGRRTDVILPIYVDRKLIEDTGTWGFSAIARLAPGVSPARAQAEADAVFRSFMAEHQSEYPPDLIERSFHHMELFPAAQGEDGLRRRFGKALYALTGIVGLLLLMAAANVTNLLLARGVARQREFAIRLATGAGRGRLARQLVTETLLLCGVGAVGGVAASVWAVRLIAGLFAEGRRPLIIEAALDWNVLSFSAGITVGVALLASLLPVWRIFRADAESALTQGHARAGESRGAAAATCGLVALQVAVSLVLLVAAVTFVRTLWNLRRIDVGVRNHGALTMSVELAQPLPRPEQAGAFWGRMLDEIRQIPGVRSAGMSVMTPLSGRNRGINVRVRGFVPRTSRDSSIHYNHVSEGYFETLGIELVRGRALTDRDAAGAGRVAVINEAAAQKFFNGREPVGDSIELPDGAAYRIVGIVKDTKHGSLREPNPPFAFLPLRQPREAERRVTLTIAAAAAGGEPALVQPIRELVARTDARMVVSEIITMRRQIDGTLLTERLLSGIASAFGVLAVLLASVGLYGVLSHHVGRQRQAIGVRMALGAPASSIRLRVLRQSCVMIGAGLAAGLPFAVMAARAADSLLWDVTSGDPANYAVAGAILAGVGLASAYIPALRASNIPPSEALRHG